MHTAGLQTFTTAFRLSRKNTWKRTFLLKILILRNLRLNAWQKAFIISFGEKNGKCSLQQLLIKPGQYIANCKSAKTVWVIRKKLYGLNKLFVASREFCLFLVVFRLAVKFFSGFTATSAKIRLGGHRIRLGSSYHHRLCLDDYRQTWMTSCTKPEVNNR